MPNERAGMAEQDLIKLYSGRILELAATIPLTDRLDDPDASVTRRSPLCGSTVTVDVAVADGRISAFGQDVKACALGQAAASILARHVIGLSEGEVVGLRDGLAAMLKSGGPPPLTDFKVLEPARDFKNRHASILLAAEATAEAMAQARQSAATA